MQENSRTEANMCDVGAEVTKTLPQVNITETVAWPLSPSSTEQLHQIFPWEATTEVLLYHTEGDSV